MRIPVDRDTYCQSRILTVLATVLVLSLVTASAYAADVVSNGTFDTNLNGWDHSSNGNGTVSWDNTVFGAAPGAMRLQSTDGRNTIYQSVDSQLISTPINTSDTVLLSLYWYKEASGDDAGTHDVIVTIQKPDGTSATIWSETSTPLVGNPLSGNVTDLDVSSFFDQAGSYYIKVLTDSKNGRSNAAHVVTIFDDIVLDVRAQSNSAPSVTPGATQVTVSPVNRFGTNTTTVSTTFSDSDQPGANAFTVSFKLREPDNTTEVVLVNAQTNGNGGLTVTDNGGGSYTASYTYDPADAQTLGLYDLYFEVSDGTDNAIDNYTNNLDELEINEIIPNNPPTVTSGATQVSVSPVNRIGTNTTTVSTTFSDSDQPGANAFTVSFKLREPDNTTEVVLVNAQTNGNGGLTVTDNGGGSYTASYTYDPSDVQTLGLYDLYFEVSDGTDNAIDNYTNNLDELEINEILANNAPVVTAGATQVSVSPVNRFGSNTTTISTNFSDSDQPGANAFTVTFKIREPDNTTELVLVNALTNGNGGLTVTDNGGGSYTASYTYDPADAQTLGLYDLYFEVSDGTDNAIDDYASNLDELEINEVLTNNAPTVAAGATQVSVSPVNRFGSNTTTISTTFSDSDQPGANAFTVTFKIREPDNTTELVLVNALTNGNGGLTVTDNGGGSYTASYTYDPADAQTLGLYDLYFEVSDGTDNAIDDYAGNLDELEINNVIVNNAPQFSAGATRVSITPVNRLGNATTVVWANFSDTDIPGINAFTVTFKIREPDNATELNLVDAQTHGNGGLTVIDLGGGAYRAQYTYDPADAQTLGLYDLYCEVSDGTDAAIDGYSENLDELEIVEVVANNPPNIAVDSTSVSPSSIDRVGGLTTTLRVPFTDADAPGVTAFAVTFKLRAPYSGGVVTVADGLANGQSGLTITDQGSGAYVATIDWDPADNQTLGYYDLYSSVTDGTDSDTDFFDDNSDELLLTNGGENAVPIVSADAVYASPAGLERIGVNATTLSATFTDGDNPGIAAFSVTFKVRQPDNATEIVLADNVQNGTGGVTVTDDGGGIYTASIDWDPPDAQVTGLYDLYFHVTDGADTSYDDYVNNLDELEVFDAVSNNPPSITAGATFALPDTVNRIGAGYTMLKSTFSDGDQPGTGAFEVTIKVRDAALTEYTVVSAATHGTQGVRIDNLGGGIYEAAVLWDPDVAQAVGDYDLYFEVTDDNAATATDGYADNVDELYVKSAAILGDGHLLRRTKGANSCGGPGAACHNLPLHQSQDCLTCHTPHGTNNIYLVRDTIQTPNSGQKEVIFKTLGIGDPYNDPDPVAGDPNSGVMADSTDGVFTGVCEVCHTTTGHHRNDGSQPPPNHHDAEDCTGCHPHSEAFAVSGGGESSGGDGCSCHSSIANPMKTSTTSYHHMILSENADYDVSSKTCLMCHVHHDIFRPDVNTGVGQRAKNLRVDITTSVVQGDASVLTNNDYLTTGTGGICLSCHTSSQTKSFTPPDGTAATQPISRTDFDAATSTHNYSVPSTFSDGSTFNSTCSKCHDDELSKSYQTSTDKFGTHDSPYGRLLDPFGAASPTDPLEEDHCFGCHSTTQNPNAGSNLDYFGVKAMSTKATRVGDAFGYTYAHPTTTYRGRHKPNETGADLADGSTRHAECADCHDVHSAIQGTHDGSSNLVSNALKGAWGVEPTSWPAAPSGSNNANVYATPSGYTKVEPAQREYQICLKCHSNYTTLPAGARNLAEEINPNYPSMHGIVQAGDNAFCNTNTMNEPWASSGITWCSDCHGSSSASDPSGPHGSNLEHLLVATATSDEINGTPLCAVCHFQTVYWSDRNAADFSRYPDHPSNQGAHQLPKGCFSCHMWDYASTAGLGLQTTDDLAAGTINVHGQNRTWVFNEQDGSAGSGQPVDAFLNGYIANHDATNRLCWTETCKVHSNKAY